ncbi:MAG: hypothetical protein ABGZ53_33645, partial [Fuerstiella sp.]
LSNTGKSLNDTNVLAPCQLMLGRKHGSRWWSVHVEFTSSASRQEFRQTRGNAESPGDFRYRQH